MPGSSSLPVLRAQIAANSRWASEPDRLLATAPGRIAAATALERQLVERHNLDPTAPDYEIRLASARRSHFQRLALQSAKARRKGGA